MLPYSKSRPRLDHDLEPEDRSAHRSLVLRLSETGMDSLDVFEGDVGTPFPTLNLSIH